MVLKASRWPALELRWDSSELRRERRRSILAIRYFCFIFRRT